MTTRLAFHKTTFTSIYHNSRIWLTATEVGLTLEHANDKTVQRIYSRYSDEFTDMMTKVVKVTIPCGMQESQVFSLRRAHLIAMFARAPVTREFHHWALGILDQEVQQFPITKQSTDNELCTFTWLWRTSDTILTACQNVTPFLQIAEHREAGGFISIGQEYPRVLNRAREVLARETTRVKLQSWQNDRWSRVLPYLRRNLLQ